MRIWERASIWGPTGGTGPDEAVTRWTGWLGLTHWITLSTSLMDCKKSNRTMSKRQANILLLAKMLISIIMCQLSVLHQPFFILWLWFLCWSWASEDTQGRRGQQQQEEGGLPEGQGDLEGQGAREGHRERPWRSKENLNIRSYVKSCSGDIALKMTEIVRMWPTSITELYQKKVKVLYLYSDGWGKMWSLMGRRMTLWGGKGKVRKVGCY